MTLEDHQRLTYAERRQQIADRLNAADEAQKKLNEAFKILRKEGLIARQRFSCCNGCAGGEIANDVEKMLDAGRKAPKGATFYSTQGGFVESPNSRRFARVRKLYLSFGSVQTEKHGEVGLPTVEVGKMICAALDKVGLHYEWDGTENQTIVIDPCPGLWGEAPRSRLERVA